MSMLKILLTAIGRVMLHRSVRPWCFVYFTVYSRGLFIQLFIVLIILRLLEYSVEYEKLG